MIKYENTFIDGHRTEKDITLNSVIVGILTIEKSYGGYQQRFKGSLVVRSYSVLLNGHQDKTFNVSNYKSARQALSACKRYVKDTL